MDDWLKAQTFVGNDGSAYQMAGILQLELLKRNGVKPSHHVLEIGCGALVAGRPIMQFLDADRYVGIEPNTWLIEACRRHFPDSDDLFASKRPIFLDCMDFVASSVGRSFDFVISHSILSHAGRPQLPTFIAGCSKVLAANGAVLASIRFHDDHDILVGDTPLDDWQYPGVNFFSFATVAATAERYGLAAEQRDDYRSFFRTHLPSNHHDWIRLRRMTGGKPSPVPEPLFPNR